MRKTKILAAMCAVAVWTGISSPVAAQGQDGMPQERVTGIGGFFFRAEDPAALAVWYRDNLGIDLTPRSYDVEPWQQEAGPTVFGPFSATTEYFGRPEQMWMINFRVADLDAMAAQLEANDIAVEIDPETYPNGRFARLADPEGNPIQLWQPATPE